MNMHYKVILTNGTTVLTAQVNLALKDGWELQGGISVTSYLDKNDETKFQYTQALVKYSDGE